MADPGVARHVKGMVLRVALLALLLAACGSPPKPPRSGWLTSVDASNPLVGRAYDEHAGRFVTREQLDAALAGAPFVLLGEKHDNADHHRLQARALASLVAAGRRPAVVFEMIDLGLQPAVDAYMARADATVDGLGGVLRWDKSGWPAWSIYRPIFEVAMRAHLPIVAAGLSHDTAHALFEGGLPALPGDLSHLDVPPLSPPLEASLEQELVGAHCGMLPQDMVAPMGLVQRVRDALMADRMVSRATPDGAVLVAGAGHVRTDRGVPVYLARSRPARRSFTVSFLEVDTGGDPRAYAADQPSDALVFTPRVDDADPCAQFHHPIR